MSTPASNYLPKPIGLTARERSRRRKAIYVIAIIALIVVLFALSYPSTVKTDTTPARSGGWLARYRDSHGLSQTELGAIDPTSETVRLGTLGMRGVASSLLWWTATQYQMKKDFTQLRATLDEIAKLQPNSIEVWRHQAWNLSYNVSVAFDDYHDKFYWVIEGMKYLVNGIKVNDRNPRLYWDMGWFISNKIGRADEAVYFRRLFSGKKDVSERGRDFRIAAGRDDDDGRDYAPDYVKSFREIDLPPTGFPRGSDRLDNWQVGKAWFKSAESKIDPEHGYPVRGMAPVIFYSDAPTCQFYYADALEKDGHFDQKAKRAWQQAAREWYDLGERPVNYSDEVKVQLNRKEELDAAAAKMTAELDAMLPGVRQQLATERLEGLTAEEREAWEKPAEQQSEKQRTIAFGLQERMQVKNDQVARRAPPEKREQAEKLAREIEGKTELSTFTNRERMKCNFEFWRTRAAAEQTEEGLAARKAIHEGDEAFAKGDQVAARPFFEKGLAGWRRVLDAFPSLVKDTSMGHDLLDVIGRYQKCLDQDDEDLPKPFILQDIIKEWGPKAEPKRENPKP